MQKSRLVWVSVLVAINVLSQNFVLAIGRADPGAAQLAAESSHVGVDRLVERETTPLTQNTEPGKPISAPKLHARLSAAHSTTSWDERDAERRKFDLPLLYLRQQRAAAPEAQRRLDIEIVGAAPDSEIRLEALSQHADLTTGERSGVVESFVMPTRPCTADEVCKLEWVLDPATLRSDFYSLRVTNDAGDVLWENPVPDRPDFVVLDTWDVALGDYAVRIYYATLFPFARSAKNVDNRLSPDQVVDFIERQFVPIIQDTWRTQVEEWGFGQPLHPEWDGDGVVEIIITDPPYALFDGTGTYTVSTVSGGRPYPERRIWWQSSFGQFLNYDTLESAYQAVFAHEFFHLMQWNVLLPSERALNRWHNLFFEAQAAFAITLQHPAIEIGRDHVVSQQSEYTRAANRFLMSRLNASYQELETDMSHRYDAALYWRFLYEQYQDAGLIRAALEEMTLGYDADIVGAMDHVMDNTLARFDGPFRTFEESLTAFARANYALRLENGRCADPDLTECNGRYYDPDHAYLKPRLEAERHFDGGRLSVEGAIPSSYGMDFLEVSLGSNVQDQTLTISFQGEGEHARFSVQTWKLTAMEENLRAVTPLPEAVPRNRDGAHVLVISPIDTSAYDRLALIITRLDSDEKADPSGEYQITVESGEASS